MRYPRAHASTPRAFTLVELMVAVGILVILLAILIPAISAVRESAKGNAAKAQMQMIAGAIDEFAAFWPPWTTGTDRSGNPKSGLEPGLPICSKGLPPWRPFELWPSADNDLKLRNSAISLIDNPGLLLANECLAYSLTAKIGKGPFIKKSPGGLVEYVPLTADPNTYYPGTESMTPHVQRVRLLDPWGTPYFYCWASEDGMWLVLENFYALHKDFKTNHFVAEELGHHKGHTAVLISAGPNKRFDFLDHLPGTNENLILGSKVKTWEGDDIVLGR